MPSSLAHGQRPGWLFLPVYERRDSGRRCGRLTVGGERREDAGARVSRMAPRGAAARL